MTIPEPRPDIAGRSAADDVESARRVLRLESAALEALAANLGDAFVAALDVFAAATGRVVVTGMGKSGHVARKIAATLSSTGTPALFVHPAEASHGDLGMITRQDAVFALSNSGETPELADMVGYAARFEIPLVSLTGNGDSTLARQADVSLVYPASEEACPMGLAPTTSTTLMLALGDAIAVSLLERKGFSPDDFQLLHPGGQLGRRLLKVADLMHGGGALPLVSRDTPLADMIITVTEKSLGCAGIVEPDGRLAGVFTDGDLRRAITGHSLDTPAAEVMTAKPKTVPPDMLASEAVRIMNENAITNLFVVEDGRPVGVLHIHACLRAGVA